METKTILTDRTPVKGQIIQLVRATRLSTPRGEFFTVRCPFCRGQHVHGAEEGLRLAHCLAGETYLLREGAAEALRDRA